MANPWRPPRTILEGSSQLIVTGDRPCLEANHGQIPSVQPLGALQCQVELKTDDHPCQGEAARGTRITMERTDIATCQPDTAGRETSTKGIVAIIIKDLLEDLRMIEVPQCIKMVLIVFILPHKKRITENRSS